MASQDGHHATYCARKNAQKEPAGRPNSKIAPGDMQFAEEKEDTEGGEKHTPKSFGATLRPHVLKIPLFIGDFREMLGHAYYRF